MKKKGEDKNDAELRQVMAEEGSRGRARPRRAVSLEFERQMRAAGEKLADPGCDRQDYIALIRDDFGLPEGSPKFLLFLKAWDDSH
jgi:hypothetical protein